MQGKGSFAYAWVLDEGSEERERGVTMTLAVATMETPRLHLKLLDAPGHRDFVPSMIAGAALFGVYIVHDVQLIAGGAHTSVQLSPDEYVAGAIAVYLDVINLFIYILQLLNDRR